MKESDKKSNENFVISIGRQYGSGGHEIGLRLAEMLGVTFYDKELITEAARNSGLSGEFFEHADEKSPGGLFRAFSLGLGDVTGGFSVEEIFKIQSDTIRDIAARESCVIVGRGADYILRDNPRCFSVFIHAPKECRMEVVAARERCTGKPLAEHIERMDKKRASFYNFYTEKRWGYADTYHLSIDSSILGIDGTAEYIKNFVTRKLAL
jgi:cytidylate kinase